MHKGVLILGIDYWTKMVVDIFQRNHLIVYGILEDDPTWHHREVVHIPVLGTTQDAAFMALLNEECASFVAYGDLAKRKASLDFLMANHKPTPISAIHPTAVVTDPVQLGHGNYIGAQVCIASDVTIGNYIRLHQGVVIEPQSNIGDLVTIGAGSVIGEGVVLAAEVTLGIGVRIAPHVTIHKAATIHAGSVVLEDVPAGTVVRGNPAKPLV